jgi:alpha-1,2-mannosyltransferase
VALVEVNPPASQPTHLIGRVTRFAGFVPFALAGAVVAAMLIQTVVMIAGGDFEVVDFRPYYVAGEAVMRGDPLYPATDLGTLSSGREYVYPPLTAILVAPLTTLSFAWASCVWTVLLSAAVVGTLFLAGVRDWRCYPVAFLWIATLNAVGLGQVTVLLGLGAAAAWHLRDRDLPGAFAVAVTLALKLILWPIIVWLAATRRHRAAVLAVLLSGAVFFSTWAVVSFIGFGDYLEVLRRIQGLSEDDAYSVFVVVSEAGAPEWVARLTQGAIAGLALGGCVLLGRGGNERGAFVLAIAAALLMSPIVWRHYFELLIVAVAVARPTLGAVWFVPLGMWFVSTGSGNGTPRQTTATVGLAALTVVLALHATRREPAFVAQASSRKALA